MQSNNRYSVVSEHVVIISPSQGRFEGMMMINKQNCGSPHVQTQKFVYPSGNLIISHQSSPWSLFSSGNRGFLSTKRPCLSLSESGLIVQLRCAKVQNGTTNSGFQRLLFLLHISGMVSQSLRSRTKLRTSCSSCCFTAFSCWREACDKGMPPSSASSAWTLW